MVAAGVVTLSSVAFACIAFEGKMTVQSGATSSTVVGSGSGGHEYCSIAGGATTDSTDSATGTITVSVEPYVNQGSGDPCQSSKLYKSNGTTEPTWYDAQPEWLLPDGQCFGRPTLSGVQMKYIHGQEDDCLDGYWYNEGVGIGPYEVRLRMADVPGTNVFNRTAGANPTYTHQLNNPNTSCAGWPENPPTSWFVLGTFDVDDNGYGSWTGSLPADSSLIPDGPTDASGVCVRAILEDYEYHESIHAGNQAPIVIL